MAIAALKKTTTSAPTDRSALAAAITVRAAADHEAANKQMAVERAKAIIEEAGLKLEAADAEIERAREADIQQAADNISENIGHLASAAYTAKAQAVKSEAEATLEVQRAALIRLQEELEELQLTAALAENSVLVAIRQRLVAPAQALLEVTKDLTTRLAVSRAVLAELVSDRDMPVFSDTRFMARLRAQNAREAPLKDVKEQIQSLIYRTPGSSDEEKRAAAEAVAAWRSVTAAWRSGDADAKLPDV